MSIHVLVVDDDRMIRQITTDMLTQSDISVDTCASGEEALEYLNSHKPDIILQDIYMEGISGLETVRRVRSNDRTRDIPIVVVSADDSGKAEAEALKLGANDFIRKPFVPDVLLMRVKNTVELHRLHKQLSKEVERKTHELTEVTREIVQTLSGAIDAKDRYTNGHSRRVAEYAREIARRAWYSTEQQDMIYMMALLHDVGKIGISDAIINKPGKLTDEEYAVIKRHPEMGAEILKAIKTNPKFSMGAHWHHERYDGKGYPDGLSGKDIPEEARIIAVADAYDAMTSNRSYRHTMPQKAVRDEIEKGRGTQFDPVYADIMLQIIDEDKDYRLREIDEKLTS